MSINIIHITNGTKRKVSLQLDLTLGLGPQSQKPDHESTLILSKLEAHNT